MQETIQLAVGRRPPVANHHLLISQTSGYGGIYDLTIIVTSIPSALISVKMWSLQVRPRRYH